MEKKKNEDQGIKALNIKEVTICDATAQMLKKAERDGVETAFHRANTMKACPIGADSACCKHCSMGPCRLNPKDPYSKVGVCGATIDTIMARNFARMVAAGGAAHTDHGMGMLDLFREVLSGHIKDYTIKNPQKLIKVAQSIGIETEDLARIFDRFFRGDHSRSQEGAGLGLSLARAIARAHGGDIRVKSTAGSGSTFTVDFPALDSANA